MLFPLGISNSNSKSNLFFFGLVGLFVCLLLLTRRWYACGACNNAVHLDPKGWVAYERVCRGRNVVGLNWIVSWLVYAFIFVLIFKTICYN